MKKLSAILLSILFIISTFTLFTGAESERIFENPPINVPKKTPVIDGVIDPNEGWSDAGHLNEDTAGYFYMFMPLTSYTDFYLAYSDEGLYFAAEHYEGYGAYTVRFYDAGGQSSYHRNYIDPDAGSYDYTNYPEYTPDGTRIEAALIPPKYDYIVPAGGRNAFWIGNSGNTVEYSNDVDYLNDDYGWNGDVISLTIDPLGYYNKAGLYGNSDYAPQYNIGIFEGDVVKVALSRVANEDITDICEAKGSLDEKSMTFEVMIPWEKIVYDANYLGEILGVDEVKLEDVIADGATHRASVTLMDRFTDPDTESVQTWGKYITVCERCDNGDPGGIVGPPLRALGLKLIMTENVNPYEDLPDGAWYTNACLWCAGKGYMSGTSKTLFSPNTVLSRAQFVQILAKIAKADLSYYNGTSFKDVRTGKWYSQAVEWAYKNGYTGGTGEEMFSPDGQVTRQELASFLRTYASKNGVDVSAKADLTGYSDYNEISAWAVDALSWAVKCDLISGTSNNTISPKSTAARAQVALIVKKLCQNVLK